MNRERIQKLIDLFETLPDEKVDMSTYYGPEETSDPYACDAVACIAGWTVAALAPERRSPDGWDVDEVAGDILWLDVKTWDALFYPKSFSLGLYTRADAIATLQHLMETGEVRWPERAA